MANAQNIMAAAAAVAAALAAQGVIDVNDQDAMAAANQVVNQAVLDYQQVNPPVPVARFALTPAVAVTGVVDFKTPEGRKLFQTATHKLEDELFDCDADGLYQFLKSLSARAEEFGWSEDTGGFLRIPKNLADLLGDSESLIDNYGTIPIQRIREWESQYLASEVRPAQDAFMMHKCLMNSISKTGKDKVTIWKDQYTVSGLSSGNLLLKIIIRESHLDTNATTSSIRTKLSSLDVYIMTIGCNITKFNGHVKLLTDGLAARGQVTNDLLVFLFKGYGAVPDMEFKSYIKRKKENHEEGDSIPAENLMLLADAKYKLQVESPEGWGVANPQEEKIIALEARIKRMDKLSKRKSNGISMDEFQKKKRHKGNEKPGKAKPGFMEKAPPKGDLKIPFKPKQWNNKDWFYCCKATGGKCEGAWRVHNPAECKGKAHVFKEAKEAPPKKNKNDSRKLKLAKAYAAVTGDSDDEATEVEDNDAEDVESEDE
jgi:hypothetical protein